MAWLTMPLSSISPSFEAMVVQRPSHTTQAPLICLCEDLRARSVTFRAMCPLEAGRINGLNAVSSTEDLVDVVPSVVYYLLEITDTESLIDQCQYFANSAIFRHIDSWNLGDSALILSKTSTPILANMPRFCPASYMLGPGRCVRTKTDSKTHDAGYNSPPNHADDTARPRNPRIARVLESPAQFDRALHRAYASRLSGSFPCDHRGSAGHSIWVRIDGRTRRAAGLVVDNVTRT
jgi:hypothetical protein